MPLPSNVISKHISIVFVGLGKVFRISVWVQSHIPQTFKFHLKRQCLIYICLTHSLPFEFSLGGRDPDFSTRLVSCKMFRLGASKNDTEKTTLENLTRFRKTLLMGLQWKKKIVYGGFIGFLYPESLFICPNMLK